MVSTNTQLAEAARRLDDAIKDLPDGCEGWLEPLDERIAELRAALAAHDAEQALPRKERPDFMAGYVAGLADGRRCAERDAAEQSAQAVPAGFKLVPVEPTEAMFTAFSRQIEEGVVYVGGFLLAYRCMLDAAPKAAAPATPAATPSPAQAMGRDAFEAWATEYSTIPLERDDDDRLTTGYTQMEQTMLWDAWQARAALAQRREPLNLHQIAMLQIMPGMGWVEIVRVVESAHGIGATTGEKR